MTIDPDRLKRTQVTNVRYDNNKRMYLVALFDPVNNDAFEVPWSEWMTYGSWEKRKTDKNNY